MSGFAMRCLHPSLDPLNVTFRRGIATSSPWNPCQTPNLPKSDNLNLSYFRASERLAVYSWVCNKTSERSAALVAWPEGQQPSLRNLENLIAQLLKHGTDSSRGFDGIVSNSIDSYRMQWHSRELNRPQNPSTPIV